MSVAGGTAFAQDVKVDFDKDANFAAIKTFSAKIGTSWNNPISEKRVLAEIEQALVEKGWAKADAAKADAIVVLHGATEKQKTLNTFYSGGYGGYGWRGMGMGGMGTATTTDIRVPRGHPGRGHLRREDEAAHVPRRSPRTSSRTRRTRTPRSWPKASDKLFKDFPPGSKKE